MNTEKIEDMMAPMEEEVGHSEETPTSDAVPQVNVRPWYLRSFVKVD
jgi:hypothetical protein